MSFKIYITPFFRGEDSGDGGVRRAVDAQRKWLPRLGVEIVDDADEADLIVVHILEQPAFFNKHADKPIIADCHGLYWAEYEWPDWALKANAGVLETIRCADGVIAHSEWVAQAIRRHTLRRVDVVPHGIDLDEWRARESEGYILWNKTRPDPVCDPKPVQQLAEMMPEQQFVTTFWPQGEPVPENVRVTGRLSFEESKVLVERAGVYLCTTRETFGVGTLEALASGVPVVGWDWGGQREFLKDGESAWLSKPGDIDSLAEGIAWATENRSDVAEQGYRVVARYDAERVMQDYVSVLSRGLETHRERSAGPRTSIIVRVFNLEQYLPDALKSVQGLEDDDWECIIVDDASTDRSGEIADKFADDPRFKVTHNEKNVYLSEAYNVGLRMARGRYILPLDADDMLMPNATNILAGVLDARRDLHIAYGNVMFIEENGEASNFAQDRPLGHSGWPIAYRYDWHEQQRNLMLYSSMYRREVWELTGGYRRRWRTAEDADFWLRAASYGFRPSMVTEADTLIYRNRPDSTSHGVEMIPWGSWYPWGEYPETRPAGAPIEGNAPVSSLDPPRVAVIIPVGPGHENLLMDALDSVDAQTYRQWECIVVNDTGAALPYVPSWARLIEAPNNRVGTAVLDERGLSGGNFEHAPVGVASARNLGIAASRARYFVPLDADDYLQPDALRQLVSVREQSPAKTTVYSAWYDSKADGEHNIFMPDSFHPESLMDHLRTKGCLHAVTALYERAAWDEVGGFDEKLPAWEDWDFQIALYEANVCSILIPQPLWVYRKNTGYRREENYAEYERSKESILKKWGKYFEGGETLAGCRSCSGRSSSAQPSPPAAISGGANGHQPSAAGQSAILIEYIGQAVGNKRYRGQSGHYYVFGGGRNRIKYVLEGDLNFFDSHRDFRRAPDSVQMPATPQLVVGDAE